MEQLEHYEITNKQHDLQLVLVAENIQSPPNVGSLFRIAEAFGVQQIWLTGTAAELSPKALRAARSADKVVALHKEPDSLKVLQTLTDAGYQVAALEVTRSSNSLPETDFSNIKKLALVLGSEKHGVSEAVLATVDFAVHVPMFGLNTSINVATAVGIALYEITRGL